MKHLPDTQNPGPTRVDLLPYMNAANPVVPNSKEANNSAAPGIWQEICELRQADRDILLCNVCDNCSLDNG